MTLYNLSKVLKHPFFKGKVCFRCGGGFDKKGIILPVIFADEMTLLLCRERCGLMYDVSSIDSEEERVSIFYIKGHGNESAVQIVGDMLVEQDQGDITYIAWNFLNNEYIDCRIAQIKKIKPNKRNNTSTQYYFNKIRRLDFDVKDEEIEKIEKMIDLMG